MVLPEAAGPVAPLTKGTSLITLPAIVLLTIRANDE